MITFDVETAKIKGLTVKPAGPAPVQKKRAVRRRRRPGNRRSRTLSGRRGRLAELPRLVPSLARSRPILLCAFATIGHGLFFRGSKLMPLYEYKCDRCGGVFEVIEKFSATPLQEHEGCGGHVERLLSAPALQFKGTGWYVTDYARNSGNGKALCQERIQTRVEKRIQERKQGGNKIRAFQKFQSSTTSDKK